MTIVNSKETFPWPPLDFSTRECTFWGCTFQLYPPLNGTWDQTCPPIPLCTETLPSRTSLADGKYNEDQEFGKKQYRVVSCDGNTDGVEVVIRHFRSRFPNDTPDYHHVFKLFFIFRHGGNWREAPPERSLYPNQIEFGSFCGTGIVFKIDLIERICACVFLVGVFL